MGEGSAEYDEPGMLEFVVRPLRSILGVAEHEMASPLADTEREVVEAVNAIRRATESIERHVEVIEGLATAIGPLTESVNQLTRTLADVTALMAPIESAEHEVDRVKQFFGLRRREKPAEPPTGRLEA